MDEKHADSPKVDAPVERPEGDGTAENRERPESSEEPQRRAPHDGGEEPESHGESDSSHAGPVGAAAVARTSRQAALLSAAIALPLAVLAGVLVFVQLRPASSAADPAASATASPTPQATAPVPMAAPALAPRPATVCRALVAQLPSSLRDLPQRQVSAGHEQNAAYGDPAVTVACGVPVASYPPTDQVWSIGGVCWHPVPQPGAAVTRPDAVVLTTVDREVPVRLRVPNAYGAPLQWAAPLSEALIASVPSAGSKPAGCTG